MRVNPSFGARHFIKPPTLDKNPLNYNLASKKMLTGAGICPEFSDIIVDMAYGALLDFHQTEHPLKVAKGLLFKVFDTAEEVFDMACKGADINEVMNKILNAGK